MFKDSFPFKVTKGEGHIFAKTVREGRRCRPVINAAMQQSEHWVHHSASHVHWISGDKTRTTTMSSTAISKKNLSVLTILLDLWEERAGV